MESAAIGSLARDIVLAADTYGRTDRLGGLRLNLEIAAAVPRRHPDVLALPESQALAAFRAVGTALMFDEIKTSLAAFGTHFDVYFNEKDLHDQGDLEAAVARLREGGHVFEDEGTPLGTRSRGPAWTR
ncbi:MULTISPECIES: hypothetical protein [Streptomyces]|uniref:hypothetical protein n=1 Tax=Streptomyces TaxID=1883 RepID=UPI001AD811A6|nr:hypothetical protein [Streptomyces melanosporofaciens]